MINKVFAGCMITLLILEICKPLENKASHQNNLINRFCIASMKSKLKFKDKKLSDEISHFTCECFLKNFNSSNSIKDSRIYCKNKTADKYNL